MRSAQNSTNFMKKSFIVLNKFSFLKSDCAENESTLKHLNYVGHFSSSSGLFSLIPLKSNVFATLSIDSLHPLTQKSPWLKRTSPFPSSYFDSPNIMPSFLLKLLLPDFYVWNFVRGLICIFQIILKL